MGRLHFKIMKFIKHTIVLALGFLALSSSVDAKEIRTKKGDIIFKDDAEPFVNNYRNAKALEKALDTLTEEEKTRYYEEVYKAKRYSADWWNIPDPEFGDKNKPLFYRESIQKMINNKAAGS